MAAPSLRPSTLIPKNVQAHSHAVAIVIDGRCNRNRNGNRAQIKKEAEGMAAVLIPCAPLEIGSQSDCQPSIGYEFARPEDIRHHSCRDQEGRGHQIQQGPFSHPAN
jgi:hypothetical protein